MVDMVRLGGRVLWHIQGSYKVWLETIHVEKNRITIQKIQGSLVFR